MKKEKVFSGNKYHRECISIKGLKSTIDVYCVLRAFHVTEPGLQHAIKKLLCAGIRDKGSIQQDLTEAIDAIKATLTYLESSNVVSKPE